MMVMSDHANSSQLDSRLEQLVFELGELCGLLRERDKFWFTWVERALLEIKQADVHGLDHLLAAYGGMGSFNDLVLGPADGQAFTPEEIAVNNRVAQLRASCWRLATGLRRELAP